MLNRVFDPMIAYRVLIYARMSTKSQNVRSPEQQIQEIERRLEQLKYPWKVVKIYEDKGISGRYQRKRQQYQQMLRDVKSGTMQIDLILVDTLERLGRTDDLVEIRRDLLNHDGVLVLTADSNFADPNTAQGRALGMVEAMRATEDGRVKAHNVLRGKRDAALLKHWPGGPPPLGYKLQSVLTTVRGREEVDYCLLVPDPETRSIIQLLFETAEQTSFGVVKLAKWMNANPLIDSKFKPFTFASVGYWLDNTIYYGELTWAKNATGIIDDTRVLEPNAPADVVRVPGFCEPIVTRECWDNVQAIRQVRRERLAASRSKCEVDGKKISALAPGLSTRYLLSGLLFCDCGLRMVASATGPYVTKCGEERRYASYVCPGYLDGRCTNGTRVPEEWIRSAVVGKLRERLFPQDCF